VQVDVNTILNVCIGLVGAIAAWQFKRMTSRLDQLVVDVALLKKTQEDTKEDHDRLIICEGKAKASHARLDNQERKLQEQDAKIEMINRKYSGG